MLSSRMILVMPIALSNVCTRKSMIGTLLVACYGKSCLLWRCRWSGRPLDYQLQSVQHPSAIIFG